jgi:hypothetical protein
VNDAIAASAAAGRWTDVDRRSAAPATAGVAGQEVSAR